MAKVTSCAGGARVMHGWGRPRVRKERSSSPGVKPPLPTVLYEPMTRRTHHPNYTRICSTTN